MTTVYLIRHSEGFREFQGEMLTSDSVQIINEKNPLSVHGEKLAELVSRKNKFKKIDVVWSSNYVRAISTAKYFAFNNNLKVNIDERLRERVQGINAWNELPKDFEEKQFYNENYKIGFGECQKEVRKRMEDAFFEILDNNKNKSIAIISHATAITFLLMKWCNVNYNGNYYFNNKLFFNGKWDYCTSFKLTFDGKKMLDIIQVN